jgi:hypothetical protein
MTNPVPPKRPVGVIVIAILGLAGGLIVVCRRILMLADVYLDADGPLIIANSYIVGVFNELTLSLFAILSGVGLLVDGRRGWWLGAIYWAWRACRQALAVGLVLLNQPSNSTSNDNDQISRMIASLVIGSLILLYIFTARVLDYFGISSKTKRDSFIVTIGIGILLSVCQYLLKAAAR